MTDALNAEFGFFLIGKAYLRCKDTELARGGEVRSEASRFLNGESSGHASCSRSMLSTAACCAHAVLQTRKLAHPLCEVRITTLSSPCMPTNRVESLETHRFQSRAVLALISQCRLGAWRN